MDFIKRNEGLTLVVKDDVGHGMVGYGHDLLPGESYPDGITQAQADALLVADVAKVDAALAHQNLSGLINQNQYNALADFCYNAGYGALVQLLAHGLDQVPVQLPRWVHAGSQVLPGLVARRKAEVDLWNTIST